MNSRQRRTLARQLAQSGDAEKGFSPKTHKTVPPNGEKGFEVVTTSPPAEGNPGGRPTIFGEGLKGTVIGLVTAGVSQRAAAEYLGIDHSTISKAIARDDDFARAMIKARAAAQIDPLMQIVAASRKDWRAAAHLLRRRPPDTDISLAEAATARQAAEEADLAWMERANQRLSRKPQPPSQHPIAPAVESEPLGNGADSCVVGVGCTQPSVSALAAMASANSSQFMLSVDHAP